MSFARLITHRSVSGPSRGQSLAGFRAGVRAGFRAGVRAGFRAGARGLATAAVLTVATLGFAVPASTASAQFGGRAGFEDAFMPDFLARDVSLFVESLGLEDWQRPILEN